MSLLGSRIRSPRSSFSGSMIGQARLHQKI